MNLTAPGTCVVYVDRPSVMVHSNVKRGGGERLRGRGERGWGRGERG